MFSSRLHAWWSNRRASFGFTMIEVVVAGAVVSIGVLATVGVGNFTLKASDLNERKTVGTNLAREGIELVRTIRDTNWDIYNYQLQRKAADPSAPAPSLNNWDCYTASAATVANSPMSCDGHLRDLAAAQHFYTYVPNTTTNANAVPPLILGLTADLRSDAYRLCLANRAGQPRIYLPASLTTCDATAQEYYRQIVISRGKTQPDGSWGIKIRSSVTWPGRQSATIVIEEFLTNWRLL